MAITQALCNSFKLELLTATHDFSSDTFKLALYTSSADLSATTTAYSTSGEASGTGYTAGGETVSIAAVTSSGSVAYVDIDDVVWSDRCTFTARGALLYNSSKSDRAVAVFDFGSDKSPAGAAFTVQIPTPLQASAAVVCIL